MSVDQPAPEKGESEKSEGFLDVSVGISVVLLATFLGICSVKAGNIDQKMRQKQVDRNNAWAWYQARNIRAGIYETAADEMTVPWPGEPSEIKALREAMSEKYRKKAASQEEKMEKDQKKDALEAEAEYEKLSAKDDQFDLCEAALAIGLAMMGVTALLKKWWLFGVAMVPSAFGVLMGAAGFMGMDTNTPAIKWIVELLS